MSPVVKHFAGLVGQALKEWVSTKVVGGLKGVAFVVGFLCGFYALMIAVGFLVWLPTYFFGHPSVTELASKVFGHEPTAWWDSAGTLGGMALVIIIVVCAVGVWLWTGPIGGLIDSWEEAREKAEVDRANSLPSATPPFHLFEVHAVANPVDHRCKMGVIVDGKPAQGVAINAKNGTLVFDTPPVKDTRMHVSSVFALKPGPVRTRKKGRRRPKP